MKVFELMRERFLIEDLRECVFEFLATSYIVSDEHEEGGYSASMSLLFINGAFNCLLKQKRNRDMFLLSCVHGNASFSQIIRFLYRVRDFVGILTNLVASKISRALSPISRVLASYRTIYRNILRASAFPR